MLLAPFSSCCGYEFWPPLHPVPKWENPRIAPKKSLTSLLKPIENDDFICFCCCCACCGSSPKQDSKVLFPGALPLASAGVGGYGIILPIDELIFFKIVKTTNQHILVSLTNPLGRVNIHLPVLIFRFFCSLAVVVGASGVEIREVPNYFRDKSDDSRPFCSTPQKKGWILVFTIIYMYKN